MSRQHLLKFRFVFLLFLLPACTASLAQKQPVALSSQSPVTQFPSIPNDTRLERKISLDEVGINLEELLQKVSANGLTLKADSSCANQKLQLRLKQRSLRALMQSLAEWMPGEWHALSDKTGYKLYMAPASMQRRKRWWDLFLSQREQALAGLREQVLQHLRAKPFRRQPNDPNPEHSDLQIEATLANQQEFFNLLPADMQEQIANQLIDLAFYEQGGKATQGDFEEQATTVFLRDLPSGAQDLLRHTEGATMFAAHRNVDWQNVVARFNNRGYGVTVGILLPDYQATHVYAFSTGITQPLAVLTLSQNWIVEQVKRMGLSAPRVWRELAAYQTSRVWPNDLPSQQPHSSPPPYRPEVFQWLADKSNMEFIADYYSLPGYPASLSATSAANPFSQPLTRPLKEELNFRALQQDTSWKQTESNLYLFRYNRWYKADNLEVPASLLSRWMSVKQNMKKGGKDAKTPWMPEQVKAQMDWEAEVTDTLTLWQLANGLPWYTPYTLKNLPKARTEVVDGQSTLTNYLWPFPFDQDVNRIFHEYSTVRFYAGLRDEARQQCVKGELQFDALSASQQQQALALLPATEASKIAGKKNTALLGLRSNVGIEHLSLHNSPRVRLYATAPAAP